MIEETALADILRQGRPPADTLRELIDVANRAGGFDNITAVLVTIT
jgi:serine/threonine protein phosphatase PrpC